MTHSLKIVGIVLVLAATGVLVVFQVNLRNELSDARERLKDLESKNGALQQDVGGSTGYLETQLSALRHELTKVQSKSEELNGKLDRCQKQVADLKSRDQQCNTMLTSLKTTSVPTTQASEVSHTSESNKVKGHATELSKAPDTPKDEDSQQADDSPLPYRGNPGIVGDLKNEDDGDEFKLSNDSEEDENEGDGDEDLNVKEKPNDDVMEKLFNDEQQRRLNLPGNPDHKEIES